VRFKKRVLSFLCKHNNLFLLWSRITRRKFSFAVNGVDKLISQIFNQIPGQKFYVELGAHNGVLQSNTKFLELYCGWTGILIEPVPSLYKELRKNRSAKNGFENAACFGFSFQKTQVEMQFGNLRTISLEGKNVIKDRYSHATKSLRQADLVETYNFSAPALTLNSILLKHNAPRSINFLSIDVEGGELEVLRGIDFENFSFDLIYLEVREFSQINNFLHKNGYLFVKKINDHTLYSDCLFRNSKFKVNM
jgi:FkbM family methyltransferase